MVMHNINIHIDAVYVFNECIVFVIAEMHAQVIGMIGNGNGNATIIGMRIPQNNCHVRIGTSVEDTSSKLAESIYDLNLFNNVHKQ